MSQRQEKLPARAESGNKKYIILGEKSKYKELTITELAL